MEFECTQVINESFNDAIFPARGRAKVGLLEIDGMPYDIFLGENVIGRDALSDIVIDKGSISSKHAVVEVDSCNSHLLYDCGSTNKTRLGKIILKPNVMYNLQGGEEILFADLKGKYTKLEQPEDDEKNDDSGSETGSESMLDCGSISYGHVDSDVGERPVATVCQDRCLEVPTTGSLNHSSSASELDESFKKTENITSHNKVVDASVDESTDDEDDFFVQPSQTVKEFSSSNKQAKEEKQIFTEDIFNPDFMAKQFAARKASEIDHSKDIFDMETQENCLLENVQDEKKLSVHFDSQNIFNTEMVAANLQTKKHKTFDPMFEAETEFTRIDPMPQENSKSELSNRNDDKNFFEAETEIINLEPVPQENASSKLSHGNDDNHLFAAETKITNLEPLLQNQSKSELLSKIKDKNLFVPKTIVDSHNNNRPIGNSHENLPGKENNLTLTSTITENLQNFSKDTIHKKSKNPEEDEKSIFNTENDLAGEQSQHNSPCKENVDNSTESYKISNGSNLGDVEMSELVISSAFTEISDASQQSEHSRTNIYNTVKNNTLKPGSTSEFDFEEKNKSKEKKTCEVKSQKNNKNKDINQTFEQQTPKNNCSVEEDVFDAPQINTKIFPQHGDQPKSKNNCSIEEHVFDAPTQINTNIFSQHADQPTPKNNFSVEEDVFDAPTQINTNTFPQHGDQPKSKNNCSVEEDVFDAPTQINTNNLPQHADQPKSKNNCSVEGDLFDAPTQINTKTFPPHGDQPKSKNNCSVEEDVFDAPTQINTNNLPQHADQPKSKNNCSVEEDFFDAPTQINTNIFPQHADQPTPKNNFSVEEDVFDAPTQINTNTLSQHADQPTPKNKCSVEDVIDAPTLINTNTLPQHLHKYKTQEIANHLNKEMKISDLGSKENKLNKACSKSSIVEKLEQTKDNVLSDALTQVNYNLNTSYPSMNSMELNCSRSAEIDSVLFSDAVTQVNPALRCKQISKLSKTKSLDMKINSNHYGKQNFEENYVDFENQETQLNPNILEKEKENVKLTCISNDLNSAEKISSKESKGHLNHDNSRVISLNDNTKGRVDDLCETETEPYITFQEAEILDDSDNTDIEDNKQVNIKSNMSKKNSFKGHKSPSLSTKRKCAKQHSFGIDESSTESDSLLASMPLDFDEINTSKTDECSKPMSLVDPDDKEKTNQATQKTICDESHKPSKDEKGSQEETITASTLTIADMDVCSTVGGMHFSTCEKSSKKLSETLIEKQKPSYEFQSNNIKDQRGVNLRKKLEETNKSLDKRATSSKKSKGKSLFGSVGKPPKSVLNDSIILSDPCSSSTPFKTSNNNSKVDNAAATKMDCLKVNVTNCPGLSSSQDFINTADCSSLISDQKNKETLPLALKRTPRKKKVSRKLAESSLDKVSNEIKSGVLELKKNKCTIVQDNEIELSIHNTVKNEAPNIKCITPNEIGILTNVTTKSKSEDISPSFVGKTIVDSSKKKVNVKTTKRFTKTSKKSDEKVMVVESILQENIKSVQEANDCITEKATFGEDSKTPSNLLSQETVELIENLSVPADSIENTVNEQRIYEPDLLQNSNLKRKKDSKTSKEKKSLRNKVLSEPSVDQPTQMGTTILLSQSFNKLGNEKVCNDFPPEKQKQTKQKDNYENPNKEEEQSFKKLIRFNKNNDVVKLDDNTKVATKHRYTRLNKGLNGLESECCEEIKTGMGKRMRTANSNGIVKSPEKIVHTKTQAIPHKRTCSSTITSAETVMNSCNLRTSTMLKYISEEPLQKSRKVAGISIDTPKIDVKIGKNNKVVGKKCTDNVDNLSNEVFQKKRSAWNDDNFKGDGNNIISNTKVNSKNKSLENHVKELEMLSEVDKLLEKSSATRKRKPSKAVEEPNLVVVDKKTRPSSRIKKKSENDTGNSTCVTTLVINKTDVRKIENSSKDKGLFQTVETSGRGSKRIRSKPERFRDNTDCRSSRSSSISSSSSKQNNGSLSDSMECIGSISLLNDQNKCDTEFLKPVKTSRNPSKKSKIKKGDAVLMKSEINVRIMEGNAEELDQHVLKKRSKSRDSMSSLTSEDSKVSMVSVSPRRSIRRVEQVLFTGLSNPTFESYISKLGGTVVDSADTCSVLVTDKVRRTVKFLCALGQGKPIVTPNWIAQSWKCCKFEDPLDHLLVDIESEKRFKFSLYLTLQKAQTQALLTDYTVHCTPNVKPPPQDIASIVECCGGKYLGKVPSKWPSQSFVISHADDKQLWKKMKVKGCSPPIVEAETLLSGILQHRLDLETHRLT